jgi:benzil reductase ((S)-benzoin forming)
LLEHANAQGMKTLGISSKELDLADSTAVEAFLHSDRLHSFFSGASQALLINNAGRLLPVGMTGQLDNGEILSTITVSIGAALAIANAFVTATERCADRRILHISSGAGRSPYAGWSIYCASKAALDHHARCVAIEGHAHLRIESLAPGIIDTGMQTLVRAASLEQFPMRPKFDKLKADGALSRPEDVAQKLFSHLQSDIFGKQTCTDLRQLG